MAIQRYKVWVVAELHAPDSAKLLDDLKRRALDALKLDDLVGAENILLEGLSQAPEDPRWNRWLAQVYLRRGKNEAAVNALHRAALLYGRSGDVVQALTLCKQIRALAPQHEATEAALLELDSLPIVRGAPVQAPKPRVCEEIAEMDLSGLFADFPAANDIAGVTELDLHNKKHDLSSDIPPSKNDTDPNRLAQQILPKTALFSALSASSFLRFIEAAQIVDLHAEQTLFNEGDEADGLYIVAEGSIEVSTRSADRGKHVAALGVGEFFGEMALLTNEARSATVRATEPAQLLRIDRSTALRIVQDDEWFLSSLLRLVQDRLVSTLLRSHPLFVGLTRAEADVYSRRFRFLEIVEDTVLIRQGVRSRGLIILVSGGLCVQRLENEHSIDLAELHPGDICGEISLLTRQPAMAGVIATRKSLAIELPAGAFYELITLNPQVMNYVRQLAHTRKTELAEALAGSRTFSEGKVAMV